MPKIREKMIGGVGSLVYSQGPPSFPGHLPGPPCLICCDAPQAGLAVCITECAQEGVLCAGLDQVECLLLCTDICTVELGLDGCFLECRDLPTGEDAGCLPVETPVS